MRSRDYGQSDGKTLRRSFDKFKDRRAAQLIHAFDTKAEPIRANVDIAEKSNELPAAQKLLDELQVAHCIITPDATHRLRPGSSSN